MVVRAARYSVRFFMCSLNKCIVSGRPAKLFPVKSANPPASLSTGAKSAEGGQAAEDTPVALVDL